MNESKPKNRFAEICEKFNKSANHAFDDLERHISEHGDNIFKCGKVLSAVGVNIIASIPNAKVGDLCLVYDQMDPSIKMNAEVMSVKGQTAILLPFGDLSGISTNCVIDKVSDGFKITVGDFMIGKVLDSFGNVIDDMTPDTQIANGEQIFTSIQSKAPNALKRKMINDIFYTGIAAIDLFITCGYGQRLAIFASPGMGKTTLLGMIVRNCSADIVVLALIGERGREIKEIIDLELTEEIRKKCIIVVSTSDRLPVEQVKSMFIAQTIAEYFRDQGKNVLIFTDSITRFARAQREVGLSSGEVVARGGFPPSVFLAFPKLMERAGNNDLGSITAFYTVLLEQETNIENDPIASEVKSIVDGHILLSRKLVEQNHFPAINVLSSLSRIADRLITSEHLETVKVARALLAKYEELEFLLQVGEYKPGTNLFNDQAIELRPKIMGLLKQNKDANVSLETALAELSSIVSGVTL
jgi:FliI/YscN family ATPase